MRVQTEDGLIHRQFRDISVHRYKGSGTYYAVICRDSKVIGEPNYLEPLTCLVCIAREPEYERMLATQDGLGFTPPWDLWSRPASS